MTEETIGEVLDQIVIDAETEDTKTRTSPKTIYKKRTSPKTIQIQDSKTVRSQAEWLHVSTSEEDGEKIFKDYAMWDEFTFKWEKSEQEKDFESIRNFSCVFDIIV